MTVLAIDERPRMTEEKGGSGIKVSNGALSILLFLLADTFGGIWWASSMNTSQAAMKEDMGSVKTLLVERANQQDQKIKSLEDHVVLQDTYIQNLRERLAAKGILNTK